MLKLILIFTNVLYPEAFLVRRTHSLSVETTIYLFFNYYPEENRLEQRYSHAPAHAISKIHAWYVARLKQRMVCFPIYS